MCWHPLWKKKRHEIDHYDHHIHLVETSIRSEPINGGSWGRVRNCNCCRMDRFIGSVRGCVYLGHLEHHWKGGILKASSSPLHRLCKWVWYSTIRTGGRVHLTAILLLFVALPSPQTSLSVDLLRSPSQPLGSCETGSHAPPSCGAEGRQTSCF